MHRANNAVIMQTEQLGCIEALEEELQSFRAKMVTLEPLGARGPGNQRKHLEYIVGSG